MTWLLDIVLGLCIVLPLRLWVVNIARIQGSSMLPTLRNREYALVWRLLYRFRQPRRQEVVICHYPGRHTKWCKWIPQAFVKRIVAVPGDTLEVIEGIVHVNGRPLDEPYLDPARCRFMRERPPRVMGPDEYFVMGDNRDSSNDSRRIGPLRRRSIRGRVVCRFWPLQRAGKVR